VSVGHVVVVVVVVTDLTAQPSASCAQRSLFYFRAASSVPRASRCHVRLIEFAAAPAGDAKLRGVALAVMWADLARGKSVCPPVRSPARYSIRHN